MSSVIFLEYLTLEDLLDSLTSTVDDVRGFVSILEGMIGFSKKVGFACDIAEQIPFVSLPPNLRAILSDPSEDERLQGFMAELDLSCSGILGHIEAMSNNHLPPLKAAVHVVRTTVVLLSWAHGVTTEEELNQLINKQPFTEVFEYCDANVHCDGFLCSR